MVDYVVCASFLFDKLLLELITDDDDDNVLILFGLMLSTFCLNFSYLSNSAFIDYYRFCFINYLSNMANPFVLYLPKLLHLPTNYLLNVIFFIISTLILNLNISSYYVFYINNLSNFFYEQFFKKSL